MRNTTCIKQAKALADLIPQKPNTEADTQVVFTDHLTVVCQSFGQFHAVSTNVGKPHEEPEVPIDEHKLNSDSGRITFNSLFGIQPDVFQTTSQTQ